MQELHNIKAKNINDDLLNKWKAGLKKKGVSVHIINGCRKFGMTVFSHHKKKYKYNPFKDIDKEEEPIIIRNRLSVEKLLDMFDKCKEELPDFYLIFCIACLVGMRLGEYSAITKTDIKSETNRIKIVKQYTRGELKDRTKTISSTREAIYPKELNEIINWHIRKFNIFSGFLFKGKDDKPVSQVWIRRRFQKLLEISGLPKDYMRVHDLRGEYVDLMHNAGVPLPLISRNIGHKRITTTSGAYTQILNEVKEEAMEKLSQKIFCK